MRVSRTGKTSAVSRIATGQSGVAPVETRSVSTAESKPSLPSLAGDVGMLMAMASVEGVPATRQRALARADKGLDVLDALHRAVLGDAEVTTAIADLADWLASEPISDRALAPLMRDIETRVRVEIARHERP